MKKLIFPIVAAVFLFGVLSGCGLSESEKQMEALKSKVLDRLNDPASAQFRKLKLLSDNKGLCGKVNAKNKLGGYNGFAAFAVDPNGKTIVLKK